MVQTRYRNASSEMSAGNTMCANRLTRKPPNRSTTEVCLQGLSFRWTLQLRATASCISSSMTPRKSLDALTSAAHSRYIALGTAAYLDRKKRVPWLQILAVLSISLSNSFDAG